MTTHEDDDKTVKDLAARLVKLHHSSGTFVPNTTRKTSATFEATQAVFRPLIANLLLDISNDKFHSVNPANPRIAAAFETAMGAEILQLMGYVPPSPATSAERWQFRGDMKSVQRAERVVSEYETIIENERLGQAASPLIGQASKHTTTATTSSSALQASKVGRQTPPAHQDAVFERIRRDREELQQRRDEERLQAELSQRDKLDATQHAALYATANDTIHRHGRLRNAHYHAREFSLQTMHGSRHFACTCAGENLEAHWHMAEANLLYSFVVHLNADATAVLHQAPEFGFQYNSLPNTENFGKTLQISMKTISEDGKVNCVTSASPIDACPICDVPFSKLWA